MFGRTPGPPPPLYVIADLRARRVPFAVEIALSPQQIASCPPSTGKYGCLGCNGGFTEGAYEYVKSAPGLANAFYIPYEQSLTSSEATLACPTAKVSAIDGELEQLSGGYATLSGYHYATKPCTTGACEHQDLNALTFRGVRRRDA